MKQRLKQYISRAPVLFRILHWGYRLFFPTAQTEPPLQEQIENTLADKSVVSFVQVGSNDGIQGDPLHQLIVKHEEWRGIFIEPVSFLFERLKRNYNNASRFIFENVAIGREKGTAKFYYVAEEAKNFLGDELPLWYDQLGSFDRNHILKHLDGKLEPFIIEEEVECIPLQEILERNNVNRIDLLHVDTEGFDYNVISQVPFDRFKPSLILYEHEHLTADEKQKAKVLLTTKGYKLIEINGDTLARLEGGCLTLAWSGLRETLGRCLSIGADAAHAKR